MHLLDEAVDLHETHRFLPGLPLMPNVLGAKALLAYRRGIVEDTLDFATAALSSAYKEPFCRMCFKSTHTVSRLIVIAREAVFENHSTCINTPALITKAVDLAMAGAWF